MACHVAYTVLGRFPGGFYSSIAITNTGTAPINGWTLAFDFGGDQKISVAWGATAAQTGSAVTMTTSSYDSSIAPGATLNEVGTEGTWTVSDASPTVSR